MRSTEHTPQSEVLEYQQNDLTPVLERQFHAMWKNLYEHQQEYQDAKWFGRSRSKKLIPNNRLCHIYTAPEYEDYYLEIIPKSLPTYVKKGLQSDDIIVIWFSEYEFIAITVYDFNAKYDMFVDMGDECNIYGMMMDWMGEMIERATTNE